MTRRPDFGFRRLLVVRSGAEEARWALPDERPSDLARLLRAALDGAAWHPEDVERLELEIHAGGETFRVERGAASRLVHLRESEESVLAEGDADVTEFVARLAGASEPLGRRAVARAGDVAAWLRREVEGDGGMHVAVQAELEAAARALGTRMRELLRRAHGMLQDATEEFAPQRGEPLSPEELSALREDVVSAFESAGGRLASVEEARGASEALVEKLLRRQARIEEYMRAEQLGRKLERQKNLMDGQRRRLERARAAARLGSPASGSQGPSILPERRARERAEKALQDTRAALSSARAGLQHQEDRSAEREALASWITRLAEMRGSLERLEESRAAMTHAERRMEELESEERRIRAILQQDEAQLHDVQQSLTALEASPEDAARARQEAATSARLAADLRRLSDVRDELRLKAREVQLAKIAAERAEEELEIAQREIEWSRNSPHPRDVSEMPDLPQLVARRDLLVARIDEAAADLAATREDLRQRTTELGTRAYLTPELVEAEAREKADIAARFGSAGLNRAEVEAELARLRESLRDHGAALQSICAEVGELALARLSARETIARMQELIPEHLRAPGALGGAMAQARDEHERLREAWDRARRALDAAEADAREAEEALRRAKSAEDSASRRLIDLGSDLAPLRQAGFASWAEVQESLLDEDEMSALEAEIAEHETLERLVEEGQRQGRDDMIAPRADPAQADLMRQLLSHAEEISRERHRRHEQRLAMLDRILDALDGLAADLERIESAAGLATPSRGGAFEERAREALSSRVLERAEVRLARRKRPWELRWEGEPSALRLRVRHSETGESVSGEEVAACGELALALAIELALAGEPVGLGMIVVEGLDELPSGDEGMVLVRG